MRLGVFANWRVADEGRLHKDEGMGPCKDGEKFGVVELVSFMSYIDKCV